MTKSAQARTAPTGRIAWRFLLPTLAAIAGSLVTAVPWLVWTLERDQISTLVTRLEGETREAASILPWTSGARLDEACAALGDRLQARVSVIASDGTVLGESSEPSTGLANHADRPEVAEALRAGTGHAVRWSATRDRRLLYAAAREERDGQQRVIRVAVPIQSMTEHLLRLRGPLGLALVTALTIGMLVAWRLSRTMRRRIDRMVRFAGALTAGTTGPPMGPEQADDLGLLEHQLAEMSRGIDVTLGAVRLERERLEAVLRGMVEGVLVTDLDGRVVLLNDQARALLGLAPDAIVTGRPLIELVRDPGIAEIPRRLATEDAVPSREVALLGDAARWLQVSAGRLTQEGGAPFGLVLVLHDISELRRLETVRQDFVANVSHELRTPLTAIRGYAETLLGPAGDERDTALRFLEIIDRHARRLGRLIDDLLALSDLEFGRTPLRRQACALGPAIDDVIQMLAEPTAQGGLSVTADRGAGNAPRLGRRRSTSAGVDQPARQRAQVHASRRPRTRRRWARHPGGHARHRAARLGHRYRRAEPGSPAAHRAILSRGQGPIPRARRHRAGTGHRQAHRPGARRAARDRKHVRPGHDRPRDAPGGAGHRRCAGRCGLTCQPDLAFPPRRG